MATHIVSPSGDVILCLTSAEVRALHVLAGEGAEGLFNDADAARAYIGGPSAIQAAHRALHALEGAANEVSQNRIRPLR